MKFYNMRRKCYTMVPDSKCMLKRIQRNGKSYYIARAVDVDGTRLTRVISKALYTEASK